MALCPHTINSVQVPYGLTPLMVALSFKHPTASRLLAENGAKLDSETTIWRDTPLDFACNSGLLDTARMLVKKGVNIHHMGLLDRTALHWAALSGNTDLIIELLRQGADPYAKDAFEYTPRDFAVQQNHKEAAAVLTWWPSVYKPQQVKHLRHRSVTKCVFRKNSSR